MAMRLRIPFIIVNGHKPHILQEIIAGKDVGTLFITSGAKKDMKRIGSER
ncbi:MAG: hypothetical protein HY767_01500 [Candidatus Omnitrophica bacterium]|nr:hypothetical protein [Candidatus Omnitrophota bacterium]